jgi:hypothetical protein
MFTGWHGVCSVAAAMAIAKSLDELIVYQKALDVSREMSAILERSSFNRDPRLRDQLGSSSERPCLSTGGKVQRHHPAS